MKKSLFILFIVSFLISSCEKFLDAPPKGKFIPKTVDEYALFLNDIVLADAGYIYTEFTADDILWSSASLNNSRGRYYLWQKDVFKKTEDDDEWNKIYNHIYYMNLILNQLPDALGGTAEQRAQIEAEAKIQRAYYYWVLVNLYSSDYQPATADKDLGVPLLLKPDIEAREPRATVKKVYDQILKDLMEAIAVNSLVDFGENYVHPGKVAAKALLARVYLYMGDYEKALEYSDAVLSKKSDLLDYKSLSFKNPAKPYSGINGMPANTDNPENIYTKSNSFTGIFTRLMISEDLHNQFNEKDLRFVFNFTYLDRNGSVSTNPQPNYLNWAVNFSIGVPEMMLIKAECLARSNNSSEAVDILNSLREKRFMAEDFELLTAANADEALELVLKERRRELFYKGLRWFDLKRLNRDPQFAKTLYRDFDGQEYELSPNDPKYLMEIAPKIISVNPDIIANAR